MPKAGEIRKCSVNLCLRGLTIEHLIEEFYQKTPPVLRRVKADESGTNPQIKLLKHRSDSPFPACMSCLPVLMFVGIVD